MSPQSRAATVKDWMLIIAAAAILAITMGTRQTLGLFIAPLGQSTGLSLASISLALAIGQFVWGAAQPAFGLLAEKWGSARIVALGSLMLAGAYAATPFVSSQWAVTILLGVVMAAGAGAGSFSILLGATARHLAPERRAFAAGFINAGSSFGQFIFAPIAQALIASFGWVSAMMSLGIAALATLPISWALRDRASGAAQNVATDEGIGIGHQLRVAFANPSYWCLHAGFFTCGFHIAFLVTHLPGEVAYCGLPPQVAAGSLALIGLFNIAGSLTAGALGNRYRMKYLLAFMYGSRAVAVLIYLMAPKTAMTYYVFAAALGFTWLATVPPTAGLVGKLFGLRHLAVLFGMTLLSHQIGGFFGAWLGGIAMDQLGSYEWMWWADIALAAAAAIVNLPIVEAPLRRDTQPQPA